jgi:hypothetical protein
MSSGVALSFQCPGMLMTAGADGKLKTWDILDGNPSLVSDQEQKLGALLCLEACPDLPFITCLGGENKNHNFTVVDAMDISAGEKSCMLQHSHYLMSFRGGQSWKF